MTNTNQFNFTISALENLVPPTKGAATYKDTRQPALSLYVTAKGVKTFFVRKRVKGRDERLKIGRFPDVKIEQARAKAAVYSGIIAERKDPLEELRKERLDNLTFGEHFRDYMERYSKLHKRSWKYDEEEINRHLSHWFRRRLSDITKYDIERLHENLGRNSGKVQANNTIRRLSSIFNKAIHWGWNGINPTIGVKRFKEISRDRFVLPSEMPFLLQAINGEENKTFKDYLLLLLLTGARKTNMKTMRWEQIIWERNEWRIPETKNGEPLILPLVPSAMEILKERKLESKSVWVFPQAENSRDHIKDPKKAWQRAIGEASLQIWYQEENVLEWLRNAESRFFSFLSVYTKVQRIKKIAVIENMQLPPDLMDVRIHDIRRTFGSYQALAGASLQIIGKSLGHKSAKTTQIYARLNLDPVRDSMEKATKVMFGKNGN